MVKLQLNLTSIVEELSAKHLDESTMDLKASYSEKAAIEETIMPTLFTFEMEALKAEEDVDLQIRQNIALFDSSIHKGIESVREGFAKETAKRAGNTYEAPAPVAEEVPVIEKQVLATPEGWLNYKLQLAECLFRCSANEDAQPRYITKEQVDEKVKTYKKQYIDDKKKEEEKKQ